MQQTTVENQTGVVRVVCTGRKDGDFGVSVPSPGLQERRLAIHDSSWTWLKQVHGAEIVEVSHAGQHAGHEADGALTKTVNCPISVTTADCAPVVLVSDTGVAVVHAGWRGALAGIIETAADRLLSTGDKPVATLVGPMITAGMYEFSSEDITPLENRFGSSVRSITTEGSPSLDMGAAVASACKIAGFDAPVGIGMGEQPATDSQNPPSLCTSHQEWFSYRIRSESERQATVAWIEPRP